MGGPTRLPEFIRDDLLCDKKNCQEHEAFDLKTTQAVPVYAICFCKSSILGYNTMTFQKPEALRFKIGGLFSLDKSAKFVFLTLLWNHLNSKNKGDLYV